MGRMARELLEKEYSPHIHYMRLIEVYEMALKNYRSTF